jgi:GNAT superfamily N-acetyltransferase
MNRLSKPPAPMLADYGSLVAANGVYVTGDPVMTLAVLTESGDSLWVNNLAVRPEYQGRGVGRAFMDFAEREAQRRKLRTVSLYTRRLCGSHPNSLPDLERPDGHRSARFSGILPLCASDRRSRGDGPLWSSQRSRRAFLVF